MASPNGPKGHKNSAQGIALGLMEYLNPSP